MPTANCRPALAGLLVLVCLLGFTASTSQATSSTSTAASAVAESLNVERWAPDALASLAPSVFQLALKASACAIKSGSVGAISTLTVIDYSMPSNTERLWVFDLRSRELVYKELVAHGQGSGENLATTFSNEPNTHASSLGLFVTEDTYVGRNGYSLRLQGLDPGFNDRARERAIVMHGAPYVSGEFAKAQGRLGRSWGCPAVRSGVARELIDRVKGSGLVFAYYPNPEWLRSSRFLGDCGATSS